MTNIKKHYFKLSQEHFNQKINNLINDKMAYHFFDNAYHFIPNKETNELILAMHVKQLTIDNFFEKLDEFKKKSINQYFYR